MHPADGSWLDQAVRAVVITAVDSRVYPMFAFLFGHGIVQSHRSRQAAGADQRAVRRVLRRRHWWMLLFGALHAALLWEGDVLGPYGLAGLVLVAAFLRRRDRTLLVWAVVLTSLLVLGMLLAVGSAVVLVATGVPLPAGESCLDTITTVNGIESWPASVLPRITFWPLLVLGQGLLGLVVPVAVLTAFWAARHRVLEEPGGHDRVHDARDGHANQWLAGQGCRSRCRPR